jgi:hypothetical protein
MKTILLGSIVDFAGDEVMIAGKPVTLKNYFLTGLGAMVTSAETAVKACDLGTKLHNHRDPQWVVEDAEFELLQQIVNQPQPGTPALVLAQMKKALDQAT